ncbi:hypothetical protein F4860DRAFT_268324 [Xylaria cubensis]|nr:hypothetical protein F4860DRAFT_268324 [Xylaria cubensis]
MAASFDKISTSDAAVLKRLGINYDSLPEDVKSELPRGLWGDPSLDERAVETFPTVEEVSLSMEQWYRSDSEESKEILNGSKPLHLLSAYSVVAPLWLPSLPPIDGLVRAVWNLIPSNIRRTIKEKAQNATAADMASIAATITSFVATVLRTLGIPPIVIRTLLGPIVRKIVDWIVKNVASLPN